MRTSAKPSRQALSEDEVRQAEAAGIKLQRLLGKAKRLPREATLRLSVKEFGGVGAELPLPGVTLLLLSKILLELGNGRNVVVLSTDTEVTTQQAANFLNVSRPYFVKLLEKGTIPFRLVGPRRRVRLGDLLLHKEREEDERHRALDELVAEAQRLGMY